MAVIYSENNGLTLLSNERGTKILRAQRGTEWSACFFNIVN